MNSSRRPSLNSAKKICIICEGYEEYEYIQKLIILKVWKDTYDFFPINAESNGKIPARYQEIYMNDSYDIVLVFCDTDTKPFEDYESIKKKINKIHGIDKSAEKVVIFANPCTMQVILLHFADIRLDSHKKSDNRKHIKSLTGIARYNAKKLQRDQLFEKITLDNYQMMMQNIINLSMDDTEVGSTNFKKFIDHFSDENTSWIENITSKL